MFAVSEHNAKNISIFKALRVCHVSPDSQRGKAAMDFVHFLSSHMLDPSVGGKRLYKSVVAQAVHADQLGYRGVGIPEHHLINILMIPSPLQMAVKVAA